MIYFDNSSTTRQSDSVTNEMIRYMQNEFANASSLHIAGVKAHAAIDNAKKELSKALGCTPQEIYLGSGGTFCNNLALYSAAHALKRRGNKIVISSIEHPSVTECALSLQNEGFDVVLCNPLTDDFENEIDDKTIIVSCMLVNNETGLILPVEKIRKTITAKKSPALFHVDAVQAFGKIPINVKKIGADFMTVSAHKINGPKGIGALYVKKGVRVIPIIHGGEQENSFIPGTYNSPAAAGFAVAVNEIFKKDRNHLNSLYKYFEEKVNQFEFISINKFGSHADHIINVTFNGYLGENVLHFLEGYNIFVSQGSACSSHSKQKSKTLVALGCDKKTADCSVRISFDYNNTTQQIDEFFEICSLIPQKLIKLYK